MLKNMKNMIYINPDSTLIALNGGRKKLPDDAPEIFDMSQKLTERIVDHAVSSKFNVCLDTSIPSNGLLSNMKNKGYDITFVVMTTPAELARKREVNRDLTQLNWGRAGKLLYDTASCCPTLFRCLTKYFSCDRRYQQCCAGADGGSDRTDVASDDRPLRRLGRHVSKRRQIHVLL